MTTTQRKGQWLFNKICERHQLESVVETTETITNTRHINRREYIYHNLHRVLFNMTDSEFDEIMAEREKCV